MENATESHPTRPYTYYDFTLSLCPHCLKRVEAKIIFEDSSVYMLKWCPSHGRFRVKIATDIEYYKRCRDFIKPGEMPRFFGTETKYGCPYDCGLCPDHEQHSCLTIIEITDRCNLTCPTCYASSSPSHGTHRTLTEVKKDLELVTASEGTPDVVQLSGGEPTIHPQFFEILDLAKSFPIRHLMINTNGIRISEDKEFAKRLSNYMPGFEVYLQFDSLKEGPLKTLRGADLRRIREQAIANLNEFGVSTTLVVTLQKGLNTSEIGPILDYAIKQPCVRGVTFQPIQIAGRTDNFVADEHRITLSEVRQEILAQSSIFNAEDLVPVPCNPDSLAMAYGIKSRDGLIPLTRYIDPNILLLDERSTIVYEDHAVLKEHLIKIFSTGTSPCDSADEMHALLCCLPKIEAPSLTYKDLFRVIIMQFLDAWNFDVRAVKRSCVHIVHRDGRIIPFDTMNLLYRDGVSGKKTALKVVQ